MTTTAPTEPSTSARRGNPLTGLFRAMRPRQWVKSTLVLAAPLASGDIFSLGVLAAAGVAFVAFSLAASGVYLVNDVQDVESDRAHPTKRNRPIASGLVAPRVALAMAVLLFAAAIAVSFVASLGLAVVTLVYIAVQVSYCLWLKHQPVMDIAVVASGFLLRAIAGGAAAGIALSQWFLLAAAFGSLFMVAGKRYAEMRLIEQTGVRTRKVLDGYTASYLRFVWTLSATVVIMTYGLWAFEISEVNNSQWSVLSMVPFVLAVLRYAVDVDNANGGEPEEIALGDRVLQVLGGVFLITLVAAVYL